jgi:uncharacterized DUF497 family protein
MLEALGCYTDIVMDFEWNPDKAIRNVAKHLVSFEEACEVFADSLSSMAQDPDHSIEEDRFVIFGKSAATSVTGDTAGRVRNRAVQPATLLTPRVICSARRAVEP